MLYMCVYRLEPDRDDYKGFTNCVAHVWVQADNEASAGMKAENYIIAYGMKPTHCEYMFLISPGQLLDLAPEEEQAREKALKYGIGAFFVAASPGKKASYPMRRTSDPLN